MQQARVIVTDYLEEPLDAEREILGDLAEVRAIQATSEDHLLERTKDADALLVYHFVNLTARVIEQLERCRVIVRCGVGYDNVDVEAARKCAVPVANVPDYGTEEVADTALGMILSLTRGIHRMQVRARAGDTPWSPELASPLYRLRGQTLGIVGMGRIGSALAMRAKAIGFQVAFHDPYLPDGMDKALGIRRMESLKELLGQSQVLSIHCPGTRETNELIGKQELDLLPDGAYLVNTARGSIVNENAVVEALANGKLAGAALDVLPHEPPADDAPILQAWKNREHPAHDRLLLNPHGAWYCEEGQMESRTKACLNVRRVLLGEVPRNVVN